jgi:hypothetical protein
VSECVCVFVCVREREREIDRERVEGQNVFDRKLVIVYQCVSVLYQKDGINGTGGEK